MAEPSIKIPPGAETDPLPDPARSEGVSIRLVALVLGWSVVWWLPLGALLAPVTPGGWVTLVALAVVATAPLGVLIHFFQDGRYPSGRVRVWAFRPFWYIQMGLPFLSLAGMLGVGAGLLATTFSGGGQAGEVMMDASPMSPAMIGRLVVAITAVLLVVLGVWGFVGAHRLVVRRVSLLWRHLPDGLDGLRIVQVSDLHVGPHSSRKVLARVADAVEKARPELIAVTGDQVDDFAGDVEHFVRAFGHLRAPLGVYAVAGNHDVYAGWSEVREAMRATGMSVLENESVTVERGGARFKLAGTGDPAACRDGLAGPAPDVDRTLAEVSDDDFVICLAHNPSLWPMLAARGVELTLSGHTHHGQLSIPRLGWSLASVFLDHAMGTYRLDDTVLYINPGTHYWGIPFRIGAIPEVTVMTLRKGCPSASGGLPVHHRDGDGQQSEIGTGPGEGFGRKAQDGVRERDDHRDDER